MSLRFVSFELLLLGKTQSKKYVSNLLEPLSKVKKFTNQRNRLDFPSTWQKKRFGECGK